jgi:hypothetical protein
MEGELIHLLGQRGVVNTADTEAVTGRFRWLQAVGGDVVLTSVTEEDAVGSLDGLTLADGAIVGGRFTGYQRASGGTLRAYKE